MTTFVHQSSASAKEKKHFLKAKKWAVAKVLR